MRQSINARSTDPSPQMHNAVTNVAAMRNGQDHAAGKRKSAWKKEKAEGGWPGVSLLAGR